MTVFGAAWPYALGAVLALALTIIVLLVTLLRRAAKVSKFFDGDEPAEPADDVPDTPAGEEAVVTVPEAFRRARQMFGRVSDGDIYDLPLFLLAGGERARDADLFANAELDLPWGGAPETGMHLGMGRGFWFFGNQGAVLDLAGSADKEWDDAMRRLLELRPERASEGVIVAFPCADLIEGIDDETERAALAANAGRIFRRLWDAQQQIGFRLPVYVLVTGCERLTGFASLCSSLPESARREMLGWSSPYGIDATYRGAWVNEAFTALVPRIDDLQMETFALGTSEADWLLRFPEALASLERPVRVCLDNLLKPTAYQGSLIFRGVYFCGREGVGAAAEARPAGKVAFLADLIEKKIFLEAGLATPAGRTVVARNRKVRIAQIAAVLAALACAGALAWAQIRFAHKNAVLGPFLQTAAERIDTLQKADPLDRAKVEAEGTSSAITLLTEMSAIDFRRYGSIVVPSSWFSPFNNRLERAIGVAFDRVIFLALDRGLRRKAEDLLTSKEYRLEEVQPVLAPSETESLAAAPIVPVDQIPEFLEMKRFVEGVRQLDENVSTFDRLSRVGSGNLRDLGAVVRYSLDQELPAAFYKKGELYQRALAAAGDHAFDRPPYAVRSRQQLEAVTDAFYSELYRRNPFDARLQQLAATLDAAAWHRATGSDATELAELSRRIHVVETALSGPDLDWAFRPNDDFNLGAQFKALIPQIERAKLLGPEAALRVNDAGRRGWRFFRSTLAGERSRYTGPFLAVRDGQPLARLSEDTLALEHALDSFVQRQFVAAAPQGSVLQANPSPGVRLACNALQLEQAMDAVAAYDRFRARSLLLFPRELQASVDQVMRDRAGAQMNYVLASSCVYVRVPPAGGATMIEKQLSDDVVAFNAEAEPLVRVMQAFARLGFGDSQRGVADVVTAEAARLMRGADDLLEAGQPYRPRLGGFSWWDGSTPPSPSAWSARDAAEVAAYSEATRKRIALLAGNYAQPQLVWLTKVGTRDRADVQPLARRWQDILDDLGAYDARKAGNAVAAIEDYIGPKMAKVSSADCSAARAEPEAGGGSRYFTSALQQLSRELTGRCNEVAARKYAEIAAAFNERLAGRYPFSEFQCSGTLDEVSPADLRAFFRKFDEAKVSAAFTDSEPELAQIRQFLQDINEVRAFFAPFLESPKRDLVPSFDVEAVFRTPREKDHAGDQIVEWTFGVEQTTVTSRDRKPPHPRWSVGKPVRVTLQWAKDAPRVPMLSPPRCGGSVKGHTVVYEYDNQWALLAALAANPVLPRYEDDQQGTLGFNLVTKPSDAAEPRVPMQVFMRLALLAPETANPIKLPTFPRVAPKGEKNVAEGAR